MLNYQDSTDRNGRNRKGSGAPPLTVAAGCFTVVLATLFFAVGCGSDSGAINNAPAVADAQPKLAAATSPVRSRVETVKAGAVRNEAPSDAKLIAKVAAATAPATSVSEPVQKVDETKERLDRLNAQLEAGEFGPALETAQSTSDAAERSQLLKLVADAQMKAGAFDAALGSIRRIPIPRQRESARQQRASRRALAGGGAQPDFDSLIELIQSETSGPWADVDGAGGTVTEYRTGVTVNPNGLLAQLTKEEHTGRLKDLGIEARVADLNDDMARPAELRLVSLTRLERELAKRLAAGRPVVETMKQLAGLTRIQYVFVYSDEKEIVIGGPAEGWRYDENGVPVGVSSGRPTMQLDDMVTVLRTFSEAGEGEFGCSINPRKEGLKRIKEFVAQSNARGPLSAGAAVRNWVQQLQKSLGLQDIELTGIPTESRVARIIVEADYRMKLIGIGKLDGGKNIPSIFDLLTVQQQKNSSLDALRWMLTMKYDSVLHSPDHDVFEIQGASVLCESENQFVTAQGERIQTGKSEATNRLFASNFSSHYAELAERDTVFADLQNIFDAALVAALLHHERAPNRIGWDLGVFAINGKYQPATFDPPTVVDSVVNHRVYRGRDIVVQVAGGVRADLMSIVKDPKIVRPAPRLKNLSAQGRAPELPDGRWWWDAAK